MIPRSMAVIEPTKRAKSRVAIGVLPPLMRRRAERWAAHKRARGTEHCIVSVFQRKPKHVNSLEGRKEHLEVLRFRPT